MTLGTRVLEGSAPLLPGLRVGYVTCLGDMLKASLLPLTIRTETSFNLNLNFTLIVVLMLVHKYCFTSQKHSKRENSAIVNIQLSVKTKTLYK